MGVFGGILMGGGALLGLGGGIMSGLGAREQARSEEAAAQTNALLAKKNADIQFYQTRANVAKVRRESRSIQGSSVAAAGALSSLSGSNLDILASNAAQLKLEELNVQQQGNVREVALRQGAQLDLITAGNAKVSQRLALGSTIVNSSASLLKSGANIASAFAGGF